MVMRWVLVGIAAAAALLGIGYWSGRKAADEAMTRVELLWRYANLSPADQEVIAQASLECGLHRVAKDVAAVSGCLLDGAAVLERRGAERKHAGVPSQSWSAPMKRLLFAAYDGDGSLRFIGDVARGAACGCFCPACGCPLIAKQGDEVQWHFAHEGSNERPECAVGAANLLRRLAVEAIFLASQRDLVFEPYRVNVRGDAGAQFPSRTVEWSVTPETVLAWHAEAPAGAPVATLGLPDGRRADLRVAIDSLPADAGACTEDLGLGWFVAPSPPLESLRHHDSVLRHFEHEGRFVWQYLPDTLGLVASCRRELQRDVDAQREAAGRRWAAIRSRSMASPQTDAESILSQPPAPAVRYVPPVPEWAPGQKPGSVYHFRRLTDDTRWVAYEAIAGGMLLVPYPTPFDGWDEYFPPRLAAADESGVPVLRVRDFNGLLMFFRDKTSISRITSSVAEFASL